MRLGWPGTDGHIGVWGHSPTAHRGERVAERTGAALVRIEDAFLRSLHPGRAGDRPLGLLIDERGAHFDPVQPSDLEVLLATHPLDDTALLNRARDLMAQLQRDEVSKYSAFDPALPVPDPGYVLVVDQTEGDAAVMASGANPGHIRRDAGFRPGGTPRRTGGNLVASRNNRRAPYRVFPRI